MRGIHDKTAEVRDLGENLGFRGAEGGSKVNHILCLNTVYISEQVFIYMTEILMKILKLCLFSLSQ